MNTKSASFYVAVAALILSLGVIEGCVPVGLPDDSQTADGDPIGGCENAPTAELPTEFTCTGPDADGWNNGAKPDGADPCPPPPEGNCTQVVIGRLFDTQNYIACPGYIVLNRTDWTIEINDNFVACTAAGELGTCDPAVLVVSDRDSIPDLTPDASFLTVTSSTVTSREICQFFNFGCEVVLASGTGPGFITCDDAGDDSTTETGFRIWRVTNYGSAAGGYITVDTSDADQNPPLLSSFLGGGIDPELRAELSPVTDVFANSDEAVDSVCPSISGFFRPALASFILMANFDGQNVGIDGVFESRCDN